MVPCNFTGAARELKKLYQFLGQHITQGDIVHYLSSKETIYMETHPPWQDAPHLGGIMEAAVS